MLVEIKQQLRRILMQIKRHKLVNKDVCLVASNCNGACILNDLGLRFNSPFVNLWINAGDFVKLIGSLKEYMNYDLIFVKEPEINYPVALLNDVKIHFQHYESEEVALKKWNERKERMNYDNIFFLFTDRDGCTEDELREFDNSNWKNKAVFVNKPHPEIKSSIYIRGFEKSENVGVCSEFKGKYRIKKYYDDFDYVSWLNKTRK